MENQRSTRALAQAILAKELHNAVILCVKDKLLMPVAALLRSLIDTTVLGIWVLKYAKPEQVTDSVAECTTLKLVTETFVNEDKRMFSFLTELVKGTDHELYKDILHPSIHGDALHIAMRTRNDQATRVWINNCLSHTHQIYVHLLRELAKNGEVPEPFHESVRSAEEQAISLMAPLLEHPDWKGTDEHLPS